MCLRDMRRTLTRASDESDLAVKAGGRESCCERHCVCDLRDRDSEAEDAIERRRCDCCDEPDLEHARPTFILPSPRPLALREAIIQVVMQVSDGLYVKAASGHSSPPGCASACPKCSKRRGGVVWWALEINSEPALRHPRNHNHTWGTLLATIVRDPPMSFTPRSSGSCPDLVTMALLIIALCTEIVRLVKLTKEQCNHHDVCGLNLRGMQFSTDSDAWNILDGVE